MKFSIESTASYNSIPPAYHYVEKFGDASHSHRDKTNWFGIFLALLSGTFFTVSAALVKGVKEVDPMILLAIRGAFQMIIMLCVAWKSSQNLLGSKGSRLLIHLQGFVGGLTLSLLYYSFRKLPLGDATTIIFSSPVIVIVLSFLLLKEPCGILRVAVMCTLFAGVVMVSRPPFIFEIHKTQHYDTIGYVCAISAAVFTALNIVIMRKCMEIHYSVVVFNLSAYCSLTALVFLFAIPQDQPNRLHLPRTWFSWGEIALVALTGLSGQVLVTKALKIEGAGKVSVTRSLDIILAYVVQVYFFYEVPSTTSIIGAVLILLSVVSMGFEREIYGVCDFIP